MVWAVAFDRALEFAKMNPNTQDIEKQLLYATWVAGDAVDGLRLAAEILDVKQMEPSHWLDLKEMVK